MLMAPENSSSFSVRVVLPASGWEMMANVRRRRTWSWISDIARDYLAPGPGGRPPKAVGDNGAHAPQSLARRMRCPDRGGFPFRPPRRRRGLALLPRTQIPRPA